MNAGFSLDSSYQKPLPVLARDEKLPLPPPADFRDSPVEPPPPTSSKVTHESSPPGATVSSNSENNGKPKKFNPLVDLMDTERLYVDQLTGIIRKIAAAWSRSNLPPPELDSMFRSVESVYKANRALYSKLKEIGADNPSPKLWGDLLMRWIDDLDAPYTSYCAKYCTGFDTWEPVQSNPRLPAVLDAFSLACPPPPNNLGDPLWTLDALFLLPKGRVKYYRKLYSRLLKNTTPGKSDHRLLVGALEGLDSLLSTLDSRASIQVGSIGSPSTLSAAPTGTEDEVVIDMRDQIPSQGIPNNSGPPSTSALEKYVLDSRHSSQDKLNASIRGSTDTLSMPPLDLERRLSTERCLDIFTMKPRTVRLQIAPPSLPYAREIKYSTDIAIRITPHSTGEEVVHERGHIFIVSDLLLVCERMTPSEKARGGANGPDMWLVYPPLAGKVLRVSKVPEQDNALQVSVMKREDLILHTVSMQVRDLIMREFERCIDFAHSVSTIPKEPPPPLPASGLYSSDYSLPANVSEPLTPGRVNDSTSSRSSASSTDPNVWSDELEYRPMQNTDNLHHPTPVTPLRPNLGPNIIQNTPPSPGTATQRTVQREESLSGPAYPPRTSSVGQAFPHADIAASTNHRSIPSRNNSRGPQPGQLFNVNGYNNVQSPFTSSPRLMQRMPSSHTPMRTASSGSEQIPMKTPVTPVYNNGRPDEPRRISDHRQNMPAGLRRGSQGVGEQFPIGSAPPSRNASIGSIHSPQGPPPNLAAPYHRPRFDSTPNYPPPNRAPPHPSDYPQVSFQIMQPNRPPSEPGVIRKSLSSRSLRLQYDPHLNSPAPPLPPFSSGHSSPNGSLGSRSDVFHTPSRPILPSVQLSAQQVPHSAIPSFHEPSPPNSPVEETPVSAGPVTSSVSAQAKCKVFLKQHHAQWKSLGSARLKLYHQQPTNIKQLVVVADNKAKSILISTIVLTDGVERVGKTGVAVELSDQGARTGIIYMIQLRNEKSADELFESLLAGSDRAGGAGGGTV